MVENGDYEGDLDLEIKEEEVSLVVKVEKQVVEGEEDLEKAQITKESCFGVYHLTITNKTFYQEN